MKAHWAHFCRKEKIVHVKPRNHAKLTNIYACKNRDFFICINGLKRPNINSYSFIKIEVLSYSCTKIR